MLSADDSLVLQFQGLCWVKYGQIRQFLARPHDLQPECGHPGSAADGDGDHWQLTGSDGNLKGCSAVFVVKLCVLHVYNIDVNVEIARHRRMHTDLVSIPAF